MKIFLHSTLINELKFYFDGTNKIIINKIKSLLSTFLNKHYYITRVKYTTL